MRIPMGVVLIIKHVLGWFYQRFYVIVDCLAYKGCDFSKWVSQEEAGFTPAQGVQYQPSSSRSLKKALSLYKIRNEDILMDIGCGKGKVMCICSRYPFRKILGLELSPDLAAVARRNFKTLGLDRCEVIVGDAAVFTDYDECTFLYMFNPVPEEVFRSLLANVTESLLRRPRKCVLIYMNPLYHDMIEKESPFRLRHTVKAAIGWFSCKCYENTPAG